MTLSLNDRPNKVTVSGDAVTVTTGSGIQGAQGATGATGAGGTVAYFGNFFSTETQTNAGATSKNTFTLNSTVDSNGVSISSGTRILFAAGSDGTYDLQFSAQFDKTDSGDDEVDVWISKNGTDLVWSNTTIMLHANNGKGVAAWNFQLNDVVGGDYFELHWWSPDTSMRVLAEAAGSSPTRPAVPSIIVTVAQVTYTQAGPQGPQGATGATGATGAAGTAATVAVGTTTTGAAGSSASVTNSGSSSAAVFNFTIPRGDTGATGATGSTGATGASGQWDTAQTISAKTDSYTLLTADAGKLVTFDKSTAVNCTVDGSLDLSAGQRIDILQLGAGQVTVVASSATVNGTPGLKLRAQYSAATILCTGTDTYVVLGDLSA